ncbi:MAG TPA: NADP-specific glutamate dehydrogenase [Deltaproteobacteria bacterium]|nr:NADP-specific glutamate dehydrogenase [Deltaproteobacteria bacterium]
MHHDATAFITDLKQRNPHQPEFHQAAEELVHSVWSLLEREPAYREARILERITEPERVLQFRVVWEDDSGDIQVNRGYRVQFSGALGPYKGGLRFHPTVNLSILKMLGFEQIFKNALTTLPMGGGKGGSDFDPKGKSDREVMRFCHAFMDELARHIGPDTDVPAGDIGVGGREIGYLFGRYRRRSNTWTGTLTGKGLGYGGSRVRTEATGYGLVYFTQEILAHRGGSLDGLTTTVSGSGNVAQYCVEQLLMQGARVITLSDSQGLIHDPAGIDEEKLEWVKELKNVRRGRIAEYARRFSGSSYHEGMRPWGIACDWAFPCATQNELSRSDAEQLIQNGVQGVSEGANMPTDLDAIERLHAAGRIVAPAKAANAGGVAVSGLEMSQNSQRMSWSAEEVDARLKQIMSDIHRQCVDAHEGSGAIDYVKAANLAGFKRTADAMLAHGLE